MSKLDELKACRGQIQVDQLIDAAEEAGFRGSNLLRALVSPSLRLLPSALSGTRSSFSRLGGRPTMPKAIEWPRWRGESLAFVAQINLDETPKLADWDLPNAGTLLFFYDAQQRTWGFDPADAGSFAVLYVPPGVGQEVADWPDDLPERARYKECSLDFQPILTLPDPYSITVRNIGFDTEQGEIYGLLYQALSVDSPDRSLLLGHAGLIQNDMTEECALVTAGIYYGKVPKDPRVEELKTHARDWRLLFQINSVDEANMMWGDVGNIYYWIRDADLKAMSFAPCWMILQCT